LTKFRKSFKLEGLVLNALIYSNLRAQRTKFVEGMSLGEKYSNAKNLLIGLFQPDVHYTICLNDETRLSGAPKRGQIDRIFINAHIWVKT